MHFGEWEKQPWVTIRLHETADRWFGDFINIPCPGGESFLQLQERISSFLTDLKTLPDESEVLVVTHGGCIRAFLALLEGHDPLTLFSQVIDYGSIRKLTYHPGK
jgi:alpha-ribazole phosphatase